MCPNNYVSYDTLMLRKSDTLCRFFDISAKGDNFSDVLFPLIRAQVILKIGFVCKEQIRSL